MLKQTNNLTSAEQSLASSFNAVASFLPGCKEIMAERQAALDLFTKNGFPSRKIERWHYFDLRSLLTSVPGFITTLDEGAGSNLVVETAAAAVSEHEPSVKRSLRRAKYNNVVKVDEADNLLMQGQQADIHAINLYSGLSGKLEAEAIENCAVYSLEEALNTGKNVLNADPIAADDTIQQINSIYANSGVALELTAESTLNKAIALNHYISNGQNHFRNYLNIGNRSKLTILDHNYLLQGKNEEASFSTKVTYLNLAAESEVNLFIFNSSNLNILSQLNIDLAANSTLNLYYINCAESNLVRQEILVNLLDENATFNFKSINLLSGKTKSDLLLEISHKAPNCVSEALVKNAISGRAIGSFQGSIKVNKIAQGTDGRLSCNSLLLSDNAVFNSKPELEIFADDVSCAHGATISQLNKDHLFYLMARGINYADARALLIKSFIMSLVDGLEVSLAQDLMFAIIDKWLMEEIVEQA